MFVLPFASQYVLTKINVPGDGSCFLHATLLAYYKPYQEHPELRNKIITQTRQDLAMSLYKVADVDKNGYPILYYDTLANGNLKELASQNSEDTKEFSIESMFRDMILANNFIDIRYLELICNLLEVDIYILDESNRHRELDVYKLGNQKIYKNRRSIILYYNGGHFDLVGLIQEKTTITVLEAQHPLIQILKHRLIS